jgi:spore maturation protein A
MLNYIWFALMAVALVVAGLSGRPDEVTKGAIDSARTAVEISIGLVGVMALWLGVMRIAEASGLIKAVARVISPLLRLLFPEVPREHPAMGAIVMNLSANVLGLSNAATPLGIKAMEELQALNPRPDTATNSMVMFMAINTASVQLVPATMIAVLAAAGSQAPTAIIGSTLVATAIGTVAAIAATRLLQPFYSRAPEAPAGPGSPAPPAEAAPGEETGRA